MPFIGIIAKENDSNFIKNTINRNEKSYKFQVININMKSIENMKNIKFDILVINENIENMLKQSNYLENIISKACYVIVNSDIRNNLLLLRNVRTNIITYGFNEKATITVSSVNEDDAMFCIQRTITGVGNRQVEEQEINIKIRKNNVKKIYNALAIFTIFEIYGEFLKKI